MAVAEYDTSVAKITQSIVAKLSSEVSKIPPDASGLIYTQYNDMCTFDKCLGVTEEGLDVIVDGLQEDYNISQRNINQIKRGIRNAAMYQKVVNTYCFKLGKNEYFYGIFAGVKKDGGMYDLGYGTYTCTFEEVDSRATSVTQIENYFRYKAITSIQSEAV